MPCNLFTYKGQTYTPENLQEVLLDPASHDEIFWQIHDDQLAQAKTLKSELNENYQIVFDGNEKEALYEAAVQSNSSSSEYKGAVRTFGQTFVDRAQDVFPRAQAGDTYESAVSREVKQYFATTQQQDNLDFELRIVNALSNPKVESLYNRFYNKGNFDKFYFELQIYAGKQQVDILRQWNHENNPQSLQEMATGILANMSQVVTVKTAMDPERGIYAQRNFNFNGDDYVRWGEDDFERYIGGDRNNVVKLTAKEFEAIARKYEKRTPTSHYAYLTVPGGTNYTENEIATPGVVPAIRGHAEFSTQNGIGWFRSDDRLIQTQQEMTGDEQRQLAAKNRLRALEGQDPLEELPNLITTTGTPTTTRRVLEMQSDLFQQGRDQDILTTTGAIEALNNDFDFIDESSDEEYLNSVTKKQNDLRRAQRGTPQNNFLQILNKDNGWVSFFVKAIIQDSAKKGYEKVLFPSGDTAAKVEGHGTLEEFITNKKQRIKELQDQIESNRAEEQVRNEITDLENRIALLSEENRTISRGKATRDFYINPRDVNSKNEYARVRINMDPESDNRWKFDFVNDPSYTGYVLHTYTVGKEEQTTGEKISPEEADRLFVTQKEDTLKYNENRIAEEKQKLKDIQDDIQGYIKLGESHILNELDRVELELEQAQSGTLKMSSIAKFYEKDIFNILQKKGFDPVRITDEYNNDWYQVDVRQTRDLNTISLHKKSFEDLMISKLQNLDIIGKKKFANEYWVMKTAPYLASDQYQPEETQRRNLEKIERINEKLGYDAIHVQQKGDGYITRINPQLSAFSELEVAFEEWNDPDDTEQIIFDKIFNAKTDPVTTDVLQNVAIMAHELGREDLIEISRYIYKYLVKNPGLSIQLVPSLKDAALGNNINNERVTAVYDAATNVATFSMEMFSYSNIEGNLETVLEELMHGISVHPFLRGEQMRSAAENEYVKAVSDLYKDYLRRTPDAAKGQYRFKDEREFIIGLTIDKGFRKWADKLNTKNNKTENFFQRLWRGFMNVFRRLLNIPEVPSPASTNRYTSADTATVLKSLSDYINSVSRIGFNASEREQGRNYDFSFAVVSKSDIDAQKAQARNQIKEEYKQEFKERIRTLVNSLRANSNSMNAIEADENFFYLFKEARKLNEDIIDEVDYLFSFINELSAMTDIAVIKTREVRDSKESNDMKIKKFNNIGNSIAQFGPIISELEQIRESVIVGTPLGDTLDNILSNAKTVASLINFNMKPLASTKMSNLAAPAVDVATKEIRAKIETLTKHLEGARKRNQQGRAKEIERKIAIQQAFLEKKLSITPEYSNDFLSGMYGDSNMLTAWMEAAIVNENIAVASVAKETSDAFHRIAPQISDNNNDFQEALDQYGKATGRSVNNIKEFNDPFLQVVSKVKSMKDDGTFEMEEKLALVSPYNLDYIQEIQKFTFKRNDLARKIGMATTEAEKTDLITAFQSLIKERKQFMKDYMEQQFKEEVYEAMELMDEDLGGYTAREVSSDLYDQKAKAERQFDAAESEAEMDAALKSIDTHDFAIKRLRYIEGRDPNSKEYKVAAQLKKYDDAMKKYRKYDLPKKNQEKFEREKQRVDRLLLEGAISQKARDHWYQKNTVTEYTEEYWNKRKELHEQLVALRDKLGIKSEDRKDINELYQRIESIVKAYRENTGRINGLIVPQAEAALVRDLEVQIDDLKKEVADLYGLTKADRADIAQMSALQDELELQIRFTVGEAKIKELRQQIFDLDFEIEKVLANKKKTNKKDAKAYFDIIARLADLNKTTTTEYYDDALDIETNKIMATVNVSELPDKLYNGEVTYVKHGDLWIRIEGGKQIVVENVSEVEQAYIKNIAKNQLRSTQWWADNHITREKFVDGDYIEVEDPIYIWKHTSPKIAAYIKTDQPSFKYKRVGIKSEYQNENYKDTPDGYNRPKTVGAKDDKYINKEYARLSSSQDAKDKATFKALNFIIKKHTESQSMIPQRYRPGYFLPSIRKTDTERLVSGDTKEKLIGKIKSIGKTVSDDLVGNEQDKDILFGYNDSMSSIPVKYLGDIDIKDQTRDVFRSILMFSSEALKRKSLMDSLPFVLAVRNIVKAEENKPVKLDSKGKVITLAKRIAGDKFVAKLTPGESQTSKQINEYIRTHYFGETIKDEPGAKQINTLLGWGAKALLGLNYSASIVNRMNAWTQSLLESEVRLGIISFKNVMKAEMIYDQHVANGAYISDIGKYGGKSKLTQMFDYFGGANFNIINKQNKTLAYSKLTEGIGKILVPNEMAEHAIANQLFIGMALEERVKQGDTMIPLYDAFEMVGNRLKLKDDVEFSERDRLQFIGRMNAAARRINGNYNLLDKVQTQKYAIGRLMLFMNNYFVPFLTRRFAPQRFSIEEGVTQEGYWRTVGSLIRHDVLSFQRSVILGWKYYTPQEKAAVARAATEVGFSIWAIAMIALLGGDAPDELKDNGYWENNAIYVLKMFRRQNEQFMLVPGLGLDDIYQKIKSPFPIAGKLGNLASMLNHAVYQSGYAMGMGGRESDFMYTRKSGWHEPGDYKIMTDISRLFGFTYRFSQMAHPDIAVKNMDAYRIK